MAKELRKKKPDLVFPIIHAFFGDSPSANLDSEIAVFTEQCYQKKEMLKDKYSPKTQMSGAGDRTNIRSVSDSKRSGESLWQLKD